MWRIAAVAIAANCLPLAAGAVEDQTPGTRIVVDAATLPPPHATPSANNYPDIVHRPAGAMPRVPPGFRAELFVDRLGDARNLAVAPNGDIFLAEMGEGRITVFRELEPGRSPTRTVFADGLQAPFGMAFRDDGFYVADLERVWRYPYRGDVKPAGPRQKVTPDGALGPGGGHLTRSLAFSRDGSRFYVGIGSLSNVSEDPSPRATVQEFRADGTGGRTFASGLRNPVGLAVYPGTGEVFTVVNERDGLGDGLVPDYLARLTEGSFFGWPYSYIGQNPQPGLADRRPDLVKKAVKADVLFRSHSAPLGLAFYNGSQFPKEYRGDAFVALHGSWNSSKPTGYDVVRVPFRDGRPVGSYEIFASGFWISGNRPARVWGRPVGLAVAKDGSLLIAEDAGNSIWRVRYVGE